MKTNQHILIHHTLDTTTTYWFQLLWNPTLLHLTKFSSFCLRAKSALHPKHFSKNNFCKNKGTTEIPFIISKDHRVTAVPFICILFLLFFIAQLFPLFTISVYMVTLSEAQSSTMVMFITRGTSPLNLYFFTTTGYSFTSDVVSVSPHWMSH